ncbi:hypothetical protein ACWTU6_31265 [Mesorhizobium sp. BHbsci]
MGAPANLVVAFSLFFLDVILPLSLPGVFAGRLRTFILALGSRRPSGARTLNPDDDGPDRQTTVLMCAKRRLSYPPTKAVQRS